MSVSESGSKNVCGNSLRPCGCGADAAGGDGDFGHAVGGGHVQ